MKDNRAEKMLKELDWDVITHYMDDEIRENLHNSLAPCSELEFLENYLTEHEAKHNQEFVIN